MWRPRVCQWVSQLSVRRLGHPGFHIVSMLQSDSSAIPALPLFSCYYPQASVFPSALVQLLSPSMSPSPAPTHHPTSPLLFLPSPPPGLLPFLTPASLPCYSTPFSIPARQLPSPSGYWVQLWGSTGSSTGYGCEGVLGETGSLYSMPKPGMKTAFSTGWSMTSHSRWTLQHQSELGGTGHAHCRWTVPRISMPKCSEQAKIFCQPYNLAKFGWIFMETAKDISMIQP